MLRKMMSWLGLGESSTHHPRDGAPDVSAPDPMAEDAFWQIADPVFTEHPTWALKVEALKKALAKLDPAEIIQFQARYDDLLNLSYHGDLWGAVHVIHGGACADSFHCFRSWLVCQGQDTFARVTAEPEALFDILPQDQKNALDLQMIDYVAGDVWAANTGRDQNEFPRKLGAWFTDPNGTPFDQDPAELRARYPKLVARFWDAPLTGEPD